MRASPHQSRGHAAKVHRVVSRQTPSSYVSTKRVFLYVVYCAMTRITYSFVTYKLRTVWDSHEGVPKSFAYQCKSIWLLIRWGLTWISSAKKAAVHSLLTFTQWTKSRTVLFVARSILYWAAAGWQPVARQPPLTTAQVGHTNLRLSASVLWKNYSFIKKLCKRYDFLRSRHYSFMTLYMNGLPYATRKTCTNISSYAGLKLLNALPQNIRLT